MNLLKETINEIMSNNLTVDDIIFIGDINSEYSCTFKEFEKLANIDYDNGFGHQYIAANLCIRFKDNSIIIRNKYDGNEWWDYIPSLIIKENYLPITGIIDDGYESLVY